MCWIEVGLLALTRYPLEAIPKQVTIVLFLCILGLVRVLTLEIGVLRHIVDVVSIVLTPFVVPATFGSILIATVSSFAPPSAFPVVSPASLITIVS